MATRTSVNVDDMTMKMRIKKSDDERAILSKKISYVLRYVRDSLDLNADDEGYIKISDLCALQIFEGVSESALVENAQASNTTKMRYAIKGEDGDKWIKAAGQRADEVLAKAERISAGKTPFPGAMPFCPGIAWMSIRKPKATKGLVMGQQQQFGFFPYALQNFGAGPKGKGFGKGVNWKGGYKDSGWDRGYKDAWNEGNWNSKSQRNQNESNQWNVKKGGQLQWKKKPQKA